MKDLPDLNTRIISLNTESCDFHNMMIWNQLADANDHIKFIENNLRELEQKDWMAIFVGHIPDECSHEYTERFRALMDRYQKTIRFNMFGHVHTDIYKLSGSMADVNDPVGVLQVCGAITTWLGNNPAYCVYELDKATMLPVSRKTYYFDLDSANETGTPEWQLLTDWTTDFDLPDLSPSSFSAFTKKLETEEMTTVDFLNRARRQPGGTSSCDDACMTDAVCSAKYMDPYSYAQCKGDPIYNWSGDFMGTFRQSMLEPWMRKVPSPTAQYSEESFIEQ